MKTESKLEVAKGLCEKLSAYEARIGEIVSIRLFAGGSGELRVGLDEVIATKFASLQNWRSFWLRRTREFRRIFQTRDTGALSPPW